MSLSKIQLLAKSTGNTQEAVVLSRHDCKIVYWDVKQKQNKTKNYTDSKILLLSKFGFLSLMQSSEAVQSVMCWT